MPSSGAASGTLFTQVSHSLSSNVVSQKVLDSRVSRNEHAYTSCYRGRRTIRDATTECIKRSHPTLGTRKGGWQHWASASQQPGTGMRYYLERVPPLGPTNPRRLLNPRASWLLACIAVCGIGTYRAHTRSRPPPQPTHKMLQTFSIISKACVSVTARAYERLPCFAIDEQALARCPLTRAQSRR